MSDKLKSVIKVVVSFSIGFFLIYLFYKQLTPQDKAEIVAALKEANYLFVFISVSFTFISQGFRSWRFQNLIEATGHKITLLKAYNAISVNYLVNLGIPRAGELARCGVLATYDNIPVNKSLGVLINERIVDVIMLFIVGIFCLLFQYDVFIKFYYDYLNASVHNVIDWLFLHPFLTIILGILGIIAFYAFTRFLFSKKKGEGKIYKLINGFKDGILSIVRLEKPLLFVLQTMAIWVCYFLMIYFALKTLPQSAHLGFGATLSVLFFGTFGFLATPGGIGAYPLILGYILSLYGLSMNYGTTVGWVNWVGQTVLILVLGLIAFLLLSREKAKLKIVSNEPSS